MIFDNLFLEFIDALNKNDAKYVLIGGYAVIIHGGNRLTGDMDIFIQRNKENAVKVLRAINDFGLGSIGFTEDDLTNEDMVIQMGIVPFRIDILNSIPGVTFEEAYNTAITYEEGGIEVKCIHINQLLANKKAVARNKDLMDVKTLEKILKRKK